MGPLFYTYNARDTQSESHGKVECATPVIYNDLVAAVKMRSVGDPYLSDQH